MIIRGNELPATGGRKPYPLQGRKVVVQHLVVRVTTPDAPFVPHAHEQRELWYMIDGEATVTLDECAYAVQGGDLIVIDPWVEHGLSTTTQARWICLG